MNKYTIVQHFSKGNIHGDYIAIEVFINDGLEASFGDSYHDDGYEKAQGFIYGYALASEENPNPEIEYLYTDLYSTDWSEIHIDTGPTDINKVRETQNEC